MKKYISEFIGTLVLVLFGCGVAVFTGASVVSTALAFGLSIVVMAYTIGNISGCHLNPAVSFAMFASGKISFSEFIKYVISQILGALAGAALLALIINNVTSLGDFKEVGLGANSYGGFGVNMLGAFITETILTFVFIFTILGVTSDSKYSNITGIVIGLALTFVHLLGIKITGTSVNPARSLGPAILLGGEALKQVWVFILAPLFGSALATVTHKFLTSGK